MARTMYGDTHGRISFFVSEGFVRHLERAPEQGRHAGHLAQRGGFCWSLASNFRASNVTSFGKSMVHRALEAVVWEDH